MHPYTQALLRSIPAIDEADDRRLTPIEGHAPSLLTPPPGCPFEPRCPYRRPDCAKACPEMTALPDGRMTRCPVISEEVRL